MYSNYQALVGSSCNLFQESVINQNNLYVTCQNQVSANLFSLSYLVLYIEFVSDIEEDQH